SDGPVLVQALAVGVCGTDLEIVGGAYGQAPPGRERLVLGHESLGRVLEAPADSGLAQGDLVVGIVRRPDPVPCPNCAAGVTDLGAHYHAEGLHELAAESDVIIECTGVGPLVFEILEANPPDSIVCLTGISSGGRPVPVDVAALNKTMVLENDVVFGSVNAN